MATLSFQKIDKGNSLFIAKVDIHLA